jgi:tRNA threonylcarbamoyladenosine biosynthesis protein TsaE
MLTISLSSLKHTAEFGRLLGRIAQPGQVILLEGDLGAGKTTLVQAIGQGLGVEDSTYITSPTFSILHEYEGRLPLYHMDFYRINRTEELEELGLDEIIYGKGLTVIEWPAILGSRTPMNHLHCKLSTSGSTSRRALLAAQGSGWHALLAEVAGMFP